ncbi:MAG: helix-turn-helix domain-containing protein [Olsenella profusa]
MKLRTVLSELPIKDFYIHSQSQLDWDLVVSPVWWSGEDSPGVLCLGSLSDLRHDGAPRDDGGLLLVYVQGEAGKRHDPPERTVVYAFGDCAPSDFQDRFLRLVNESGSLAVRRARLFKAYLDSYDLQQFANRAFEVIGAPLIVSNADNKVLASAGDFPDDDDNVTTVIEGGYVTDQVNRRLEADGIMRMVRDLKQPVLSTNGPKGAARVTSIIRYHHLEMGRLDLFETTHAFTGPDLELVDYASSLAGIMIDRLGVAGARVGMGSTVFADLLSGNVTSVDAMRARLGLRDMPSGGGYALARVTGEEAAGRDYYLRAGQIMQDSLRGSVWTVHGDALVVLLALGVSSSVGFDDYVRCERLVMRNRSLMAVLENNGMHAFVSEPFSDIRDAVSRLDQCVELGELTGPTQTRGGRVHFFWRDRFRVLAARARLRGDLDALLDQRVMAMERYDRHHRTSYLETAVMSVRYPGSPADAADALSVHRNTYFYRVNKIDELFFLDLKNGEDRLAVAFTTHVLEGLEQVCS